MKRYMIEREIAGVGALSNGEMAAAAAKSARTPSVSLAQANAKVTYDPARAGVAAAGEPPQRLIAALRTALAGG